MTLPLPAPPSPPAAPAVPLALRPRDLDAVAAVLSHVAGLPRSTARARVEAVVHAGGRVLEVLDGSD